MTTDSNLHFIGQRIGELRTAIMYNSSETPFRLLNNIVEAVRVDDEGQLWFRARRPLLPLQEEERSFPARLKFYRKGICFYLEVSGKATVVESDNAAENSLLLRMDMGAIEYCEPQARKEKNRWERWLSNAYQWFLRHISTPHEPQRAFSRIHN